MGGFIMSKKIASISLNDLAICFLFCIILLFIIPQFLSLTTDNVFSFGDPAQLQHLMRKAERGENITLGYIGGSITKGYKVPADKKYEALVSAWFKNTFPRAHFKVINAGIGGSGSFDGANRIQHDLLRYNPDLIIVEHAVNDLYQKRDFSREIRQIYAHSHDTAILILFMAAYKNGDIINAEPEQAPVAAEYEIPAISFKNHIISLIASDKIQWQDFMLNDRHPNETGHQIAADLIIQFLTRTRG
jgi:lysophospholipase L1-like esterase